MDRRGFLRFLGMGIAAAVAPTKAYSFIGGILRKRPEIITPLMTINSPVIVTPWEWWINGQGPFDPDATAHFGENASAYLRKSGSGRYLEIVYVTTHQTPTGVFDCTLTWEE